MSIDAGQGVDLAPAVVGDMETVDAERNGAFGVCGMKHAFQKQWAFPDIPVSCDFVPGKAPPLSRRMNSADSCKPVLPSI